MPKFYEERQTTVKQCTAIECSKCGKKATPSDFIEWDEFISIHIEGGYGSVWGDGSDVNIDLCQSCAHSMFAVIATVHDA